MNTAAGGNRSKKQADANVHETSVIHRSQFDGYFAVCPCGWSSEEMAYAGAADKKGREHEEEARTWAK